MWVHLYMSVFNSKHDYTTHSTDVEPHTDVED